MMKRVLARLRSGRVVEVLEVYKNGKVFVVSLDGASLDVTYRGGIGYTGTPARYISREDIVDAWIDSGRRTKRTFGTSPSAEEAVQ